MKADRQQMTRTPVPEAPGVTLASRCWSGKGFRETCSLPWHTGTFDHRANSSPVPYLLDPWQGPAGEGHTDAPHSTLRAARGQSSRCSQGPRLTPPHHPPPAPGVSGRAGLKMRTSHHLLPGARESLSSVPSPHLPTAGGHLGRFHLAAF